MEKVYILHYRGTKLIGVPFNKCDNLQMAIVHEDTLTYSEDSNLWLAASPHIDLEKLAKVLNNCPFSGILAELAHFLVEVDE